MTKKKEKRKKKKEEGEKCPFNRKVEKEEGCLREEEISFIFKKV